MSKCLCTVSNNNSFQGTELLIKSFLKNNSWFTDDIIVLCSQVISQLDQENKEKLINLYNKIKIIEINDSQYIKIQNYLKRSKHIQYDFSEFIKYEIFSIQGYERLVYFNYDCLILGDISEVFNQSHDFVVTQETKNYPTNNYRYFQNSKPVSVLFNSGFFSISGNMFNQQITTRLQNYTISKPNWDQFEQSVMNHYFKNNDLQFLHNKFNTLKVCFQDSNFKKFDSDIRVIRYIGEKPWQRKTKSSEMIYQHLEKLWINFNSVDTLKFDKKEKPLVRVIDIPRETPIEPNLIIRTKKQEEKNIQPQPNTNIINTQIIETKETTQELLKDKKDYEKIIRERKIHQNKVMRNQLQQNIDLSQLGVNISRLSSFPKIIKDKKICLIANSSDLLKANLGEYIDSHDIVIRCNSFVIDKQYTGEKTNIHVLYYLHNENLEKEVNTRIIYSPNIINWKNFIKHKIIKNKQNDILDLYWPMQHNFINSDERLFPTTGFNTIRTIHYLSGYLEFNLIGFNFYENGLDSIYRVGHNREISKTHNFKYEKEWIIRNAKKVEKYIITL